MLEDLVREGILKVIAKVAFSEDARVQRDIARTYANLTGTEDIRTQIINSNSLPSVLNLCKSLDIACQRYATLALCNLCSSTAHKVGTILNFYGEEALTLLLNRRESCKKVQFAH